jgi:uncharacterized protein (TIRG00374 family)
MKRWQSLILGVVISVATLAYALNGNDLSKIGDELASGNYLWIIPCSALIGLGLWFRGLRWRFLLNERITALHSFHITNISYFLNAWLPLRLGEVARAYLVTRLKPPIAMFTALSSVVVERLIDLLAVVILVVLAVLLTEVPSEVQASAQLIGVVSVLGIFVLAFFAARRQLAHAILSVFLKFLPFLERLGMRSLVDKVLDGIAPLGSARGVSYAVWWSLWSWVASIVAGYVLLFAFYDQPNWAAALLMIAAAALAVALPAVPGSVGPFEAAIIVGLQLSGMVDPANGLPQERAFAFAVVLHLVNAACYVILGYIGLLQERVSLGEVFRAARTAVARKPAPEAALETSKTEG